MRERLPAILRDWAEQQMRDEMDERIDDAINKALAEHQDRTGGVAPLGAVGRAVRERLAPKMDRRLRAAAERVAENCQEVLVPLVVAMAKQAAEARLAALEDADEIREEAVDRALRRMFGGPHPW